MCRSTIRAGLVANGEMQMKANFSKREFGNFGARSLAAMAAALLLTGTLATNALAAPRAGGAGLAGGHAGHEHGAPLFNNVPSNPAPNLNPSSPYTVPTTPETPVSPASPGSVFGNG
jgi:hypothetical protein